MGKKLSVDKSFGSIQITTQKKTYQAGEQVNGTINLNLQKSFPSNFLYLLIEGKEKVKLTQNISTGSDDNANYEIVVHKEENEFYSHNFPIYSFPGNEFPPGQYSFPFSFRLEDTLPGSFSYKWDENGEKNYGKIKYKLWAGLKEESTKRTLYDKFTFIVDQQYEYSSGSRTQVFEQNLKGYCYSNLGKLMLECHFPSDSYHVGDMANLTIGIDSSDLNVKVDKIVCSLNQHINLQAKDFTKQLKFKITSLELPGLDKGDKKMMENSIPVSLPISTRSEYQASSNGLLIKNEFKLEILAKVDACLCYSDEPKNDIDAKVFNKRLNFVPPVMPNFNPQIMSPYVCPLSNDFRMTQNFKNNLFIDQNVDYPLEN